MSSIKQLETTNCANRKNHGNVFREAGATVTRNVEPRDMNVHVPATDERERERWKLLLLVLHSTTGHI